LFMFIPATIIVALKSLFALAHSWAYPDV
jgi:hypothetical protein